MGESKDRLGVKPAEHVSHRFGSMCQACVRLSLLCLLAPTSAEQQHSYVITSRQKYALLLPSFRIWLRQRMHPGGEVQRQHPVNFTAFLQDALVLHLSIKGPVPAARSAERRLPDSPDSAGWFGCGRFNGARHTVQAHTHTHTGKSRATRCAQTTASPNGEHI